MRAGRLTFCVLLEYVQQPHTAAHQRWSRMPHAGRLALELDSDCDLTRVGYGAAVRCVTRCARLRDPPALSALACSCWRRARLPTVAKRACTPRRTSELCDHSLMLKPFAFLSPAGVLASSLRRKLLWCYMPTLLWQLAGDQPVGVEFGAVLGLGPRPCRVPGGRDLNL